MHQGETRFLLPDTKVVPMPRLSRFFSLYISDLSQSQIMKFTTVLAFATAAVAAPSWGPIMEGNNNCLNEAQANKIVELNALFQIHADVPAARAAAESLFSPTNYTEYGDSINSLRGAPVSPYVVRSPVIRN